MDEYWVWDREKAGYAPTTTEWWSWDAVDGVMRPIAHDGWEYDPLDGKGKWKSVPSEEDDNE